MTDPMHLLDEEQLLADAHALERLSDMEEWKVLDRILANHGERILLALRQRGLGLVDTEALRAELDTVDFVRYRPIALRRAIDERDKIQQAQIKAAQDVEHRR